jgi:hypothetical protein
MREKEEGRTCDAKWDGVHSSKRMRFSDLKYGREGRRPHDVADDLKGRSWRDLMRKR